MTNKRIPVSPFEQDVSARPKLDLSTMRTLLHPPAQSKLESAVAPGEYQLMAGNNDGLRVGSGQISLFEDGGPEHFRPIPGVYLRGAYVHGGDVPDSDVVSFLYHKLKDGQLETTERGIVLTGLGYGELLPDHAGQPPTWYLVGPQIGSFDHETGRLASFTEVDGPVAAKNFSVACIVGGPFGEPILANPQ